MFPYLTVSHKRSFIVDCFCFFPIWNICYINWVFYQFVFLCVLPFVVRIWFFGALVWVPMPNEDLAVSFFFFFSNLFQLWLLRLRVQCPYKICSLWIVEPLQPLSLIINSFSVYAFFVEARFFYFVFGHMFSWCLSVINCNKFYQ